MFVRQALNDLPCAAAAAAASNVPLFNDGLHHYRLYKTIVALNICFDRV